MEVKLRNAVNLKPEVELDISDRMTRTKMKIQQRPNGTYRVAVSGKLFNLHGPHYQPFEQTVEELEKQLDIAERNGYDLRK